MSDTDSIAIVCRYRVKPGKGAEFEELLAAHWPALSAAGLTTDEPATVMRASDSAGNVAYLESFSWKDQRAVGAAHESPTVMQLWEPMGALCEDMEFWDVEAIEL